MQQQSFLIRCPYKQIQHILHFHTKKKKTTYVQDDLWPTVSRMNNVSEHVDSKLRHDSRFLPTRNAVFQHALLSTSTRNKRTIARCLNENKKIFSRVASFDARATPEAESRGDAKIASFSRASCVPLRFLRSRGRGKSRLSLPLLRHVRRNRNSSNVTPRNGNVAKGESRITLFIVGRFVGVVAPLLLQQHSNSSRCISTSSLRAGAVAMMRALGTISRTTELQATPDAFSCVCALGTEAQSGTSPSFSRERGDDERLKFPFVAL